MLVKDLMKQVSALDPAISASLTVAQLVSFASLSADFLQRTKSGFKTSPTACPIDFLAQSLDTAQPQTTWAKLWTVMYKHITTCLYNTAAQFRDNGILSGNRSKHALIITEHTFQPPTNRCSDCGQKTMMRKKVNGYLFEIGGIKTMQYIPRYCRNCKTTHTPCFIRRKDAREYYTPEEGQPEDYLQVTQHFFMSHQLVDHFNHLQSLGIVSISNLVESYNQTHATPTSTYLNDFQNPRYTRKLSQNVCSLALDIHRLMRCFNQRGIRLKSDATGSDDRRYFKAMLQHAEWLKHEGTEYSSHVCSICTEVDMENSTVMRAMVTDGITVGHWRCSASAQQLQSLDPTSTATHCEQHLDKVTHRFCPEHHLLLHNICEAQPCVAPAIAGTKTCGDIKHKAAYRDFKDKTKSFFGLPRRFNRPNTHIRSDPSELISTETGEVALSAEDLMYADVDNRKHEAGRNGGEGSDGKKINLSRNRTHNEQLMVAPCGVVVARKTFYKSESVPQVKEFIKETFPKEMPQVIYYDNACNLYAHIRTSAEDRETFRNTLLPVDAFHMKTHKESHKTCRINNDPNKFPELKRPNGAWKFNASIAEIVNVWFGRFDSMCRGMHPVKYNFFLDEMIRLHNSRLCEKLRQRTNVQFLGSAEFQSRAM